MIIHLKNSTHQAVMAEASSIKAWSWGMMPWPWWCLSTSQGHHGHLVTSTVKELLSLPEFTLLHLWKNQTPCALLIKALTILFLKYRVSWFKTQIARSNFLLLCKLSSTLVDEITISISWDALNQLLALELTKNIDYFELKCL